MDLGREGEGSDWVKGFRNISPESYPEIRTLTDKFTIKVKKSGVLVLSAEGKSLEFTAGEALMLLDILKNEEAKLRKVADEASPMPIKIRV